MSHAPQTDCVVCVSDAVFSRARACSCRPVFCRGATRFESVATLGRTPRRTGGRRAHALSPRRKGDSLRVRALSLWLASRDATGEGPSLIARLRFAQLESVGVHADALARCESKRAELRIEVRASASPATHTPAARAKRALPSRARRDAHARRSEGHTPSRALSLSLRPTRARPTSRRRSRSARR